MAPGSHVSAVPAVMPSYSRKGGQEPERQEQELVQSERHQDPVSWSLVSHCWGYRVTLGQRLDHSFQHTHARTQMCTHVVHTLTHIYTCTNTDVRPCLGTHTCTHMYTHAYTNVYPCCAHTHTHKAQMCTRAVHTYTMHTHTDVLPCSCTHTCCTHAVHTHIHTCIQLSRGDIVQVLTPWNTGRALQKSCRGPVSEFVTRQSSVQEQPSPSEWDYVATGWGRAQKKPDKV